MSAEAPRQRPHYGEGYFIQWLSHIGHEYWLIYVLQILISTLDRPIMDFCSRYKSPVSVVEGLRALT